MSVVGKKPTLIHVCFWGYSGHRKSGSPCTPMTIADIGHHHLSPARLELLPCIILAGGRNETTRFYPHTRRCSRSMAYCSHRAAAQEPGSYRLPTPGLTNKRI